MIRRLKKDVLKELPAKNRHIIPLPIKNRTEYNKASKDIIAWLKTVDASAAKKAKKAMMLAKFGILKRLAAQLKIEYACNWIDNFLESNPKEKLVVFTLHKKIINHLQSRYKNISLKIDGSTPTKMRLKTVEEFEYIKKNRILLGQIRSAGTGLTITKASTAVFVELYFTPAVHTQAEDRVHRIGQTEGVNIYYLIAKGTIEESLCTMIQSKQKIMGEVLDGDAKSDDFDIWDQLQKEVNK